MGMSYTIHTVPPAPYRRYGHDWPTREIAERMAEHYAEVLHRPMGVDPTPEPLVSLYQLHDTDDVLVEHVEVGAVGHLTMDRRVALCGVATSWRLSVGHLLMFHGQLCPVCAQGRCR